MVTDMQDDATLIINTHPHSPPPKLRPMAGQKYVYYYDYYYYFFYTLSIKDPKGFWKKIDTKEKIVGVTITPSSPPEQKNRAAERCYIAARARKRAGTKIIIIIYVKKTAGYTQVNGE